MEVVFSVLLTQLTQLTLAALDLADALHELANRRNEIDDAGSDGTPWHHGVVGLARLLRENNPAHLLDRPHPQRTIRAGAAEHHREPVAAPGGNRAEEQIDGCASAARFGN